MNAVNSTKASLVNAYAKISSWISTGGSGLNGSGCSSQEMKIFDISTAFWYNPELNYKIFMLPGILVILVTLIGMFLTALNLVREKELGTSEQINVTPVQKISFYFWQALSFLGYRPL